MMVTIRPHPTPSMWSAPFWNATARHELVAQVCLDCLKLIMYPKRYCPVCLGENLGWQTCNGQGEIYTLTIQQAGPPSGFESLVPYVLVIIKLDEGVQLMSNLVGEGAETAQCGDRVKVDFLDLEAAGVTLPIFRLAGPLK
jgi:uncharacterized OB-fold protein